MNLKHNILTDRKSCYLQKSKHDPFSFQLKVKHHSRSSIVEELETSIHNVERQCPGICDAFVGEVTDLVKR